MKSGTRAIPGSMLLVTILAAGTACRSVPAPLPAPPPSIVLAPGAGVVGAGSGAAIAMAESNARAFTAADVDFMTKMIPHHAQAVIMSRWAATHGARGDVRALAERIIVS